MLKRIASLFCDLIAIGTAAVCAFLVRENFEVTVDDLRSFAPYLATTVVVGATCLLAFRIQRGVWRLSTLRDYLRICALSIFIVALTMCVGFLGNRLQNIARALPVIQVVFTILGLVGLRVAARLLFAWRHAQTRGAVARLDFGRRARTVLLVGLNRLTMLYVRSVEDLATSKVRIAGIVTDNAGSKGRTLGTYPILGRPKETAGIIADLAVHGVFVTHVCIMTSRAELSDEDFAGLEAACEAHDVEIEFFIDTLVGSSSDTLSLDVMERADRNTDAPPSAHARANEQFWLYAHRPYWKVKRVLDIVASAALICLTAPLFVVVGLIVAADVGLPVIFWQERPGAKGRPFRIYKFRTMRGAFAGDGSKRDDEARASSVGRALRLFRLDELPQLFNVLVGEMSFVGPRPLLPIDQFPGLDARLAIAPGITGWAQVNGGRAITAADKAALDLWYLQNASLAVDMAIAFATLRTMFKGEITNQDAIDRAWTSLRARRPLEAPSRQGAILARLKPASEPMRAAK